MMKITEIYTRSFKSEPYGMYILDAENNIMFDVLFNNDEVMLKGLVDLLNGRTDSIQSNRINQLAKEKGCTISSNGSTLIIAGKRVLEIRGYGYLTGVGGLNLSDKEAVETQHQIVEDAKSLILRE